MGRVNGRIMDTGMDLSNYLQKLTDMDAGTCILVPTPP